MQGESGDGEEQGESGVERCKERVGVERGKGFGRRQRGWREARDGEMCGIWREAERVYELCLRELLLTIITVIASSAC